METKKEEAQKLNKNKNLEVNRLVDTGNNATCIILEWLEQHKLSLLKTIELAITVVQLPPQEGRPAE